METIGVVSSVIAAAVVVLFLVLVLVSIPDIARYLRVRRM